MGESGNTARTGNSAPIGQLRQLVERHLLHDRRKAIIAGVLAAVALIVVVRAVIKVIPAKAIASGTVIEVPVATGGADAQESRQAAMRDEHIKRLNGGVRRDLFKVDARLYPLPQKKVEVAKVISTTTSAPADAKVDLERQMIQAEAAAFRLESILSGRKPAASISGSLLRIGQKANGFEVLEINARTCVLVKKGVRVVLELEK